MARKKLRRRKRSGLGQQPSPDTLIRFCRSVHSTTAAREQCFEELQRAYQRAARRTAARHVAKRLVTSRHD